MHRCHDRSRAVHEIDFESNRIYRGSGEISRHLHFQLLNIALHIVLVHILSRCFVCYSASARGSSSRADADHGHKLNCFRVHRDLCIIDGKICLRRFANFHRSRDSESSERIFVGIIEIRYYYFFFLPHICKFNFKLILKTNFK